MRNPFRAIRHIPGQPLSYLKNPKVACTSIELSLWQAVDPSANPNRPHRHQDSPFLRNTADLTEERAISVLASTFFSVVRNPYVRVLSAYLDKVQPRWKLWPRVSAELGLAADRQPSLLVFLAALHGQAPEDRDHHFRPQHLNLMHGTAPVDFLGHMEKMDAVTTYLRKHGVTLARFDIHSTGASSQLAMIDRHCEGLIRDMYAEDFAIYGYSEDMTDIAPVRPAAVSADRGSLRKVIMEKVPG